MSESRKGAGKKFAQFRNKLQPVNRTTFGNFLETNPPKCCADWLQILSNLTLVSNVACQPQSKNVITKI